MDKKKNNEHASSDCCGTQKSCMSKTPFWIVLSVILALALIFRSGELASLIPFLAVFVCPIVMLFAMKSMHSNEKK